MKRISFFGLLILTLVSLNTGCSGKVAALAGPAANPLETLGVPGSMPPPRLRIQPQAQGNEAPYTPVMMPPDVRRAFVRGHINGHRDLIAGHWWYVRLRDWSWPVELEQTAPAVDAPILTPLAPRPPVAPSPPTPTSSAIPRPSAATPTVGQLLHQTSPSLAATSATGTSAGAFPYVLPRPFTGGAANGQRLPKGKGVTP